MTKKTASVSFGWAAAAAAMLWATLAIAESATPPARSIFDEETAPPSAAAKPDGASATSATAHDVAEPTDYRLDDYRSPVPKTLKGARVVTTVEAEALFAGGKAVFIDVYPRAPKPPNLPAGTLWRDLPHTTIKGGHWLPNVGFGTIPPDDLGYLTASLAALTGGDKARPLVFYCLRDCWMSWNTAKRAMSLGYTDVIWFPDGTDGWQEAGNETASVQPDPPANPK